MLLPNKKTSIFKKFEVKDRKNINKKLQDLQVINNNGKFNPQIDIEENFLAVNEIKKYYLNKSSSLKKITRSLIILFLKLYLSIF